MLSLCVLSGPIFAGRASARAYMRLPFMADAPAPTRGCPHRAQLTGHGFARLCWSPVPCWAWLRGPVNPHPLNPPPPILVAGGLYRLRLPQRGADASLSFHCPALSGPARIPARVASVATVKGTLHKIFFLLKWSSFQTKKKFCSARFAPLRSPYSGQRAVDTGRKGGVAREEGFSEG